MEWGQKVHSPVKCLVHWIDSLGLFHWRKTWIVLDLVEVGFQMETCLHQSEEMVGLVRVLGDVDLILHLPMLELLCD